MTTPVFALEEFHPSLPGFQANPYPFYDRLRQEGPVVYLKRMERYWAIGHAEVSRLFTDKTFGVEMPPDPQQAQAPMQGPYAKLTRLPPHMLVADPPTHTRLRSLVSKAFTPRTVERLRPHIEAICDRALSGAGQNGRLNIASDIAFPLPATVIAELLGVPVADQDQFRLWSNQIVLSMDAGSSTRGSSKPAPRPNWP